jgi:hypothetical protein
VGHQHSLTHMGDAIMDACEGDGQDHLHGAPARAGGSR